MSYWTLWVAGWVGGWADVPLAFHLLAEDVCDSLVVGCVRDVFGPGGLFEEVDHAAFAWRGWMGGWLS